MYVFHINIYSATLEIEICSITYQSKALTIRNSDGVPEVEQRIPLYADSQWRTPKWHARWSKIWQIR